MTEWNPDSRIKNELVDRLREGSDPDQKGGIFISSPDCPPDGFSANDIIQEVESGTPLGRAIYEAHLKVRNY